MPRTARRLFGALIALVLVLGVTACGDDDDDPSASSSGSTDGGDKGSLTVGAKLDPEAQLLGNLMALTLEEKGYDITRKIPTGNTDVTRAALTGGDIDIYWEFTSSGLTILEQDPIGDPEEAYEKAKELDAENGITWLPSAEMNDTYALAVAEDGDVDATALGDLTPDEASELKLCVDPEGGFRKDVLPLVADSYGLEFPDSVQVGADLIPQSIADGTCDIGIVYSTSFLIPENGLRVLEDDERAFGAYTPAPTIKTDTLADFPDLEADLAELTELLDTETITDLNAQAEGDGKKTAAVAEEFLAEQGIIE
jgi:osmoprotectant transport system substrate-binding protein